MNRRSFLMAVAGVAAAVGMPSLAAAALRHGEDCFLVANNVEWWPGLALSDLVPLSCTKSIDVEGNMNFEFDEPIPHSCVSCYGVAMKRDGKWLFAKWTRHDLGFGDTVIATDQSIKTFDWRQIQS